MKDIKLYLDKLHADAEDCSIIARLATTAAKRDTFTMMYEAYKKLATELEKIVAVNIIVNEERDRRLIGLLGDDDAESNMAEIAKLLGQTSDKPQA